MFFGIRDPGSEIWDPGSGIRDGKNPDPGSGINIPDPQHWFDGKQTKAISFFLQVSTSAAEIWEARLSRTRHFFPTIFSSSWQENLEKLLLEHESIKLATLCYGIHSIQQPLLTLGTVGIQGLVDHQSGTVAIHEVIQDS
jgi:hypothetical protein